MEKRKLTNFIEKYHLAGNANSVGLDVNDQTLSCEFITDDQNLVGRVTMEEFDIEDVRLGVYNTSQLTKLLTALDDKIDVDKLPLYDLQLALLRIRSKSVGETISLNLICPDDEKTSVEVSIDLDSIKVKKDKSHTNIVKLDNDLSLKLKYPSMKQFIESNFEAGVETVSNTMDVVISSIDMINNEEESWNASESTKKELEDFIDQLNTKQFKLIENFFDTMPKLSHKVKVKNPKTDVESTVLLEGLAAFFN